MASENKTEKEFQQEMRSEVKNELRLLNEGDRLISFIESAEKSEIADETRGLLEIFKNDASIQKMVRYDVKNEWQEELVKVTREAFSGAGHQKEKICDWEKLDAWQKMCCYKIYNTNTSKGAEVDCDVALRTMVIYALAFPFVLKPNEANDSKESRLLCKQKQYTQKYRFYCKDLWEYRGDTMNSYGNTVREYLRKKGLRKKRNNDNFPDVYNNEKPRYLKDVYLAIGADSHWEAAIIDKYDDFKDIIPVSAHAFMEVYHTMGNFIPVPFSHNGGQFNGPRGNSQNIKDFWDLTLLCIYNYYQHKEDSQQLEPLFDKPANRKGNITLCVEWLNSFQTWDNFVENNYLQDFVCKADGKYGEPKELWDGHLVNNGSVMPENEQFDQFFTRSTEWILARGVRIALKVQEKLREKDIETLANKIMA